MAEIYANLFTENEDGEEYGYFPIGKNNKWHSGIHLYGPNVKPLLSGKIVAYRHCNNYAEIDRKEVITAKEYYELDQEGKECYIPSSEIEGNYDLKETKKKEKRSANFYLIKHSVANDKLVFYTLYNHIKPEEEYLKKFSQYSSDCKILQSLKIPFTKKINFKFLKPANNEYKNENSAMPGSWFEAEIRQNLPEYIKNETNLIVNVNFNNKTSSKKLKYNEIIIKTLIISNEKLSLFQSNRIFSANDNESVIGNIPYECELERKNFKQLTISLSGKEIIKDSNYLLKKLLLPMQYLGNKERKNLYNLISNKNTEKEYEIAKNEKISYESCPLSFTEYNYNFQYGGKKCIINNEVLLLIV